MHFTNRQLESLIQDKEAVIEVINQVFDNSFRLENIIDKLPKIEISRIPASHYDPETLLHNEHGTGITRSDWSKYLNTALQSKIEKEFEWWFNEVGYEV